MMSKKQWSKSFFITIGCIFWTFTLSFAQEPQKQSNGIYQFVDKSGRTIKKLGKWKQASSFRMYGGHYAVVKDDEGNKYYLTKSGKAYKLARGLQRLTKDKEAVIFTPHFLNQTGYRKLFLHPQLKIIIIDRSICQTERNEVQALMAEITIFKQLEVLDVRLGDLKAIPKEIGQLTQLKYLRLENQCLERIPSEIAQLKNLQVLELSDNQIQYLPSAIGQLTQLQELNLSRNSLVRISASIGRLRKLQKLNLYCNRVSFKQYTSERAALRYWKLRNKPSSLKILPKTILQLSSLKSLNLSENKGLKMNNIRSQLRLKLPHCIIHLPHSRNRF